MAGDVDDLAGRRQPVEVFGVPHFDAVVDARQDAAQYPLRDPHESVRIVRGDLERVPSRDLQPVAARAPRVANLLAQRLAYRASPQDLRDDRALPREVRA